MSDKINWNWVWNKCLLVLKFGFYSCPIFLGLNKICWGPSDLYRTFLSQLKFVCVACPVNQIFFFYFPEPWAPGPCWNSLSFSLPFSSFFSTSSATPRPKGHSPLSGTSSCLWHCSKECRKGSERWEINLAVPIRLGKLLALLSDTAWPTALLRLGTFLSDQAVAGLEMSSLCCFVSQRAHSDTFASLKLLKPQGKIVSQKCSDVQVYQKHG